MLAPERHLEPDLIAGDDLASKFYVIQPGENEKQFIGPGLRVHLQSTPVGALDEESSRLRHRLAQENARHDRALGEVPREVRLIDGDVLDRHNAPVRLELYDAVDKQKGVAVRQEPRDVSRRQHRIDDSLQDCLSKAFRTSSVMSSEVLK